MYPENGWKEPKKVILDCCQQEIDSLKLTEAVGRQELPSAAKTKEV